MLYFIFINQCTFDIIGILISKLNKIKIKQYKIIYDSLPIFYICE